MKEPARLVEYLEQIKRAAFDACSFVEGLDSSDFLADRRTQQAVTMSLLIIGEAASKILTDFPEFVTSHPALPWRNMRGLRNRIAHGYFEVDQNVVWETVRSALPDLLRQVSAILAAGPDSAP